MKTVKIGNPIHISVITLLGFLFISGNITAQQTLRVMTYNIRYANPGDGINAWPKRKEKVMALIEKYNPDIICLQEVLYPQLKYISAHLKKYSYAGEGREGNTKGEFSPVFIRNGIVRNKITGTRWLSESGKRLSKGWDAALPRIFTFATCNWEKNMPEGFLLINTHLDHIGTIAREESVKKIMEFTRYNMSPVILTGDFNFTDTTAAYRYLEEAGIFKDAYRYAVTKNGGNTCCGFGVKDSPTKRIDFIFFSSGFRPLTYIVDTTHAGEYYPSDHLPVIVDLEWQQK